MTKRTNPLWLALCLVTAFALLGVSLLNRSSLAQGQQTFKAGDRVEADSRLISKWRKGRVAKIYLTDSGQINVYEIKFDNGETELVRADSNAVRPLSGGENDETAAATSSPELSVTARQVYDDYHNNQLAAERKYVGKVVKVTGKIWIIKSSEIVRSYVDLTSGLEG
ncbi:MAG: OB-fold protein [Pyrinomonadaceae bacterium]